MDRSINVLDYLERAVNDFPDKTALADEKKEYTFSEVAGYSRQIGGVLAGNLPARSPVPVLMDKCADALLCFFGAVYSGCFYCMIDAKFPAARIETMLGILSAKLIVTKHDCEPLLQKLKFEGKVIFADDILKMPEGDRPGQEKKTLTDMLNRRRLNAADTDPLYVNFTSGSTGVPKGVLVSHRSVLDFIPVFTETFSISSDDIIGNQAPFDFDVSVKDIYSCMYTGAKLQIIPKKFFSFPMKLLDCLDSHDITCLIWAVSALCIITTLGGFDYKIPQKVNKVIFSGEVMPVKHLLKWQKALPKAMFANVYGPTEITCNCLYHIVDGYCKAEETIPAGRPFANEKVFLLDDNDRLVDPEDTDSTGEICVAGTCLALGYYNSPELTSKNFVQNPLNSFYPETIYRTGDLAKYDSERRIVFTSRKDFQIKHMGHRIELAEIERAMERVEEVTRAVVIYDEKKHKLCAFYEGPADKVKIIGNIAEYLPAFMIPNVFVNVQSMPLTGNGKIDRTRLMQSKDGKQ